MTRVHPSAVIGEGVSLADGVVIGPHAVLLGPCSVGEGASIGAHACVGVPPGHRDFSRAVGWDGEPGGAGVVIGAGAIIGEQTVIEQGTAGPTSVGDRDHLLPRTYLGHDVVLAHDVTIAPSAALAGHVRVWERANIGMGALVHQRTTIGPGAMVGMGAAVQRDVAAFTTVMGNPARIAGVNARALAAVGADAALIDAWPRILQGAADLPPGAPDLLLEVLQRWRRHTTVGF